MSGGAYDYGYGKIENLAYEMRNDMNTPLRKAFLSHLALVAEAAKAIEWNESGDGDPREDELIKKCISPSAEIEHAIKDAREAIQNLKELLP